MIMPSGFVLTWPVIINTDQFHSQRLPNNFHYPRNFKRYSHSFSWRSNRQPQCHNRTKNPANVLANFSWQNNRDHHPPPDWIGKCRRNSSIVQWGNYGKGHIPRIIKQTRHVSENVGFAKSGGCYRGDWVIYKITRSVGLRRNACVTLLRPI